MKDDIISNTVLFNKSFPSNKRQKCPFSVKNPPIIDYKNLDLLVKFVSEKGRILPSRISGVSAKKQRELKVAIKRARVMGLLPFVKS